MEKLNKLLPSIILPIVILVVINLLVVDWFFINLVKETEGQIVTIPEAQVVSEPTVVNSDKCGLECQAYVNAQIATLAAKLNVKLPTPTPARATAVPTKAKVTTVAYVTVPGSGSTMANDWQDLSGTDFYFNTADYPGLVSVYFEPTVSLQNGNGTAYVRLFDVTHGIAVEGGWSQTANQTPTALESGQALFWSGKNLIRVQAKSLTADTAVFHSGRLKITTSN